MLFKTRVLSYLINFWKWLGPLNRQMHVLISHKWFCIKTNPVKGTYMRSSGTPESFLTIKDKLPPRRTNSLPPRWETLAVWIKQNEPQDMVSDAIQLAQIFSQTFQTWLKNKNYGVFLLFSSWLCKKITKNIKLFNKTSYKQTFSLL